MYNLKRRKFIKNGAMTLAAFSSGINHFSFAENTPVFKSNRPPVKDRNFVSEAVEAKIKDVKKFIKDPEIAWLFENCFPNTLDTTVKHAMVNGKPDTFVITGDIDAMWLRDSTAQVWPYLPLIKEDKKLKTLIQGVINRQAQCILLDPYANAFHYSPKEPKGWASDQTDAKDGTHERKWEIDSLCYPIRLSYHFWKTTEEGNVFDKEWDKAMRLIVKTFKEQQRKNDRGSYSFVRVTGNTADTPPGNGWGNPIKPVGMICSMFRPSDDATLFPFLIPSNLFAAVSLNQLSELYTNVLEDVSFATQCKEMADEVKAAVMKYAVAEHLNYGKVFAFEADGYGNKYFMDDSNVPSLLSLPYLGVCDVSDPVYQNTRKFVWSLDNPYFFKGKVAEGIGGPHVGLDMVWPMSLTMKALTSTDDKEIAACINTLKATHAGTGFMHEAFHKDNPASFTRKWFAWANTLFGEMILKVYKERPYLLKA